MISSKNLRNDVPIVELSSIVEFLDHKRKPITESERVSGPYPYYGANGIQDYVADWIFDEELILLAEDGGHFEDPDRGVAYKISGKSWVNNHAHVLRPTNVDVNYLKHILRNMDLMPYVNGATRLKLTKANASRIKIPLPPIAEQKRIAALLDKAENIMRLREQTIAKLDSLVESTFFKLFGNAKNNEMSWNTVPLGDLCDVEWGNTSITKASYVEHGFPAYSAAGFDGYLAHAEHTGDGIVLSAIGARCGKCFRAEGEWTAIKNTITIKTKSDEVDIDFLFQILNDENFWEIRGAGQPFITLGTARKLKVITPPKKLQSKFVNMYEEIKNQRKNFESSHMKLAEAFSSLQHQSFAVN